MTRPVLSRPARLLCGLIAIAAATSVACRSPSAPTPAARLIISPPTQAAGSIIPIELRGTHSFIWPDSGVFAVPITVTSDWDVQWAKLDVYLYSGSEVRDHCGRNIPDLIWEPFAKGQTAAVTISGFEFSGPCHVTLIRAYLHTRSGRDTFNVPAPTENQSLASSSLVVNYTFR